MTDTAAWPNAFLIGATKAGTTSLHDYMGQHPDVYASPDKEPNFFTNAWDAAEGDDALEAAKAAYLELFAGAGDAAVRLESTTTYLHHPRVPERILSVSPHARVMASLRDPIARAYSHYWMHVAAGLQQYSFHDAIRNELEAREVAEGVPVEYVAKSRYHAGLRRHMDAFGRDRVHVILTARLKEDARGVLADAAAFLGVDGEGMDAVDLSRRRNRFKGVPMNPVTERVRTSPLVSAVARRLLPQRVRDYLGNEVLLAKRPKPPVEARTAALLQEALEPDVEALEKLLGRDLPELRASFPA